MAAARSAHVFSKLFQNTARCNGKRVLSVCNQKINYNILQLKTLYTRSAVLPAVTNSIIFKNENLQCRNFAADHSGGPSIEEQTMDVLKLFDKVDPSKVTIDAHFLNDLGLDSLDVVEVVMAFEDEFGIEISDEEAEKVFTVKEAAELIKAKLD